MSTPGLLRAVRAEWTKLRTDTGNGWLLLGLVAVTVSVSTAASATARCTAGDCGQDPVGLSLTGVTLGQTIAAILAVLVAKACVVSGAVFVAGSIAVPACALAGHQLLPDTGFTAAHLRAAVGSVLYLVLVALLALGIATAVRDAATATGVVLGLLYLFPLLGHVVTDPALRRLLAQIGPMPAGLAVQATTDLHRLPIGPWAGLGVLALWAVGALLGGGIVLRLRDA